MPKVVVIGGGWSGVAAAIRARKSGAEVVIAEKTDLLLGLGNVGGIMRNNGRFTAAEENIALGAGELFEITDRLSTHKDVDFPGHPNAIASKESIIETSKSVHIIITPSPPASLTPSSTAPAMASVFPVPLQ